MWHVWGTGEVHTGFWWGDLRERDLLEDLGVDGMGSITLEWTLNRLGERELDFYLAHERDRC
jgi:hypothetical protein